MQNNKKLFNLFILLLIVFTSCSNGNNFSNNNSNNVSNNNSNNISKQLKLNISDARNLYIGKSPLTINSAISRTSSNNTKNKLFKVTDTGYVQEITYTYDVVEKDVDGNIVKSYTETATKTFVPQSINRLNEDYLIVSFISEKYLVNISTGACYEWPSSISIYDMTKYAGAFGGEYAYTDSSGNIYTVAQNNSGYGVYKLDLSDLNNITMSLYSSRADTSISMYAVDKNGNLGYFGRDSSNSNVYRLRKANGGYENIPSSSYYIMFFIGFDGNMYYQSWDNANLSVTKININNNSTSFTDYTGNNANYYLYAQKSGILKVKNKKIILGINELSNGICVVYNENTNSASSYSGSEIGMTSMKFGVASDDYYYVAGVNNTNKNVIQRIDPLTKEYSTIAEGFDVYKLCVSDDEIITFNALKMNDGAIVIGTINSNGNLNILDESLEEEVTVLTQI